MFGSTILGQEHLLYIRKLDIQKKTEQKSYHALVKNRKGYINKKHNLTRK